MTRIYTVNLYRMFNQNFILMKKNIISLLLCFLFATFTSGIFAQGSEDKSKKSEEQTLQEQQQQLEMLQEFMKKNMEEQKEALEKLKKESEKWSKEKEFFYGNNPHVSSGYHGSNISFIIRKSLQGTTSTQDYPFTVDTLATKLNINVRAKCQKGIILVQLYSPRKKKINSIAVNPTEDLSWNQVIRIVTKDDEKKYAGKWFFRVVTKDAEGSYTLSVTTY